MRSTFVVMLVLVVGCKSDPSDVASEDDVRTSFSYHLELKGKGFIGGLGSASGHKALGVLGCLTTTIDRNANGNGYLIIGDSTRKAKKEGANNSEVWVVQVNNTVTIEVDGNFRPQDNHNQFSLLRYFVHLAKTRSGQKGMTFGYDIDYGGMITAVDGSINKVKKIKRNIRYEMKGSFTKAGGGKKTFNLGHTEHGSDGEIVKAEIVFPKGITGEKSDVGILVTPVAHCQVNGADGQRWNFDNPVTAGQG